MIDLDAVQTRTEANQWRASPGDAHALIAEVRTDELFLAAALDEIQRTRCSRDVWKHTADGLSADNERLRATIARVDKLCDRWDDYGRMVPNTAVRRLLAGADE